MGPAGLSMFIRENWINWDIGFCFMLIDEQKVLKILRFGLKYE